MRQTLQEYNERSTDVTSFVESSNWKGFFNWVLMNFVASRNVRIAEVRIVEVFLYRLVKRILRSMCTFFELVKVRIAQVRIRQSSLYL